MSQFRSIKNEISKMHLKIKNNYFINRDDKKYKENTLLFGKPLHCKSYDNFIKKYERNSLNNFLSEEARKSIGNYLIISRTKDEVIQVITSVGYCGGYILNDDNSLELSTIISPLLNSMNNLKLNYNVLISYLDRKLTNMPSFSTPFAGITRLPPGICIEIKSGKIKRQFSYLNYFNKSAPNFNIAFEETIKGICESLNSNEEITLMYSGGQIVLLSY